MGNNKPLWCYCFTQKRLLLLYVLGWPDRNFLLSELKQDSCRPRTDSVSYAQGATLFVAPDPYLTACLWTQLAWRYDFKLVAIEGPRKIRAMSVMSCFYYTMDCKHTYRTIKWKCFYMPNIKRSFITTGADKPFMNTNETLAQFLFCFMDICLYDFCVF